VKSKCKVVPLGIDTQRFADAGSRLKSEIEKLRSVFGPQFVLFVGRLRYYKGVQFLIQAMQQVQAPLVVIGAGPMESDLKAMAANYGVSEKVQFLGEVSDDDLVAFFHACTLLALPSIFKSEAYGLVQLEAHACGKPVVSTRLGTGVEFVNMDGKTGLLVPPADSKALADAIKQLLSDPGRIQRMGDFARKRAQTEFDLEQMFDKIDAVYEQVIANGS
jgi:rhamnosyl/mannosyltransferase